MACVIVFQCPLGTEGVVTFDHHLPPAPLDKIMIALRALTALAVASSLVQAHLNIVLVRPFLLSCSLRLEPTVDHLIPSTQTNDDGFGSANIRALYGELTRQGHSVLMVAPAENQSTLLTALSSSRES